MTGDQTSTTSQAGWHLVLLGALCAFGTVALSVTDKSGTMSQMLIAVVFFNAILRAETSLRGTWGAVFLAGGVLSTITLIVSHHAEIGDGDPFTIGAAIIWSLSSFLLFLTFVAVRRSRTEPC